MSNRTAPPSYPSRAVLARELCCSETTIDEWVKNGTLPAPIKLPSGAVRWDWTDVRTALDSLKRGAVEQDPYDLGAHRAAQITAKSIGSAA